MGNDAAWEPELLARATRRQILVRMLLNLKRLYVKWRSFPQARMVTDLLLTLTPNPDHRAARSRSARLPHERFPGGAARSRGVSAALEDTHGDVDDDQREEDEKVWEHVKALRRRVAGLN